MARHSALSLDERCRAATSAATTAPPIRARRISAPPLGTAALLTPYRSFDDHAPRSRRDAPSQLVPDRTRGRRRCDRQHGLQSAAGEPARLIDAERPAHRPKDSRRDSARASSGEDEPVSLSADRLDSCRLMRVALDLRTQLRDVDLTRPAAADVGAVPQRFHDRRAADDAGPADRSTGRAGRNSEGVSRTFSPATRTRPRSRSMRTSPSTRTWARADRRIDDLACNALDRDQLAGLRERRRVPLLDPDDRPVRGTQRTTIGTRPVPRASRSWTIARSSRWTSFSADAGSAYSSSGEKPATRTIARLTNSYPAGCSR